jgi:hypothetical protein
MAGLLQVMRQADNLLKGVRQVVVQEALAEVAAEHFSPLRLEQSGTSACPKEKPPTNG